MVDVLPACVDTRNQEPNKCGDISHISPTSSWVSTLHCGPMQMEDIPSSTKRKTLMSAASLKGWLDSYLWVTFKVLHSKWASLNHYIVCLTVLKLLFLSLSRRIVNVSLPKKTRNNGTLYALIFVHQAGVTPWQDQRQVHLVAHLTAYMVPKLPEISLISGEDQTQVWWFKLSEITIHFHFMVPCFYSFQIWQ